MITGLTKEMGWGQSGLGDSCYFDHLRYSATFRALCGWMETIQSGFLM